MKKKSDFLYPVGVFFILLTNFILNVTSIAIAQDRIHVPILGPESFSRTTQKPITETRNFTTPYSERVYTIKITNGEPKVTAAFIDLNGERLFAPKDFQKSSPVLEKTITLVEHNTLFIQLRSKPTSNITIEIYGSFYPPPPPQIDSVTTPTNIPTQTIKGTCEPRANITIASQNYQTTGICDPSNGEFTLEVVLDEGSNNFDAWVTDLFDLQSKKASFQIILDTTPPVFSISSPPEGSATNITTTDIYGTIDDNSASVFGNLIEGSVSENTFTIKGLNLVEGPNSISLKASDPLSNTSSQNLNIILDTIPPEISVTFPENGYQLANKEINVSGTIDDRTATVKVNGYQANVADNNFTVNSIPLNEGDNTLTVTAADPLGNTTTASVDIFVDTIPPAIEITSPLNDNKLASTTVSVNGTIVDATANVSINGIQATVTDNTFSLDELTLNEGENIITAEASDPLGNSSTYSIQVLVDTTPPVIEITSPINGSEVDSETINVSGTIDDNTASVTVNNIQVEVTNNSFTASGVTLQEGDNTITVNATDQIGNNSTTSITVSLVTQRDIDLKPIQLDLSNVSIDNQSLKVNGEAFVTIANENSSNTNKSFEVLLYEDRNFNAIFEADLDSVLARKVVSEIINGFSTLDTSMAIQGALLFNGSPIFALVDPSDLIKETDETNNTLYPTNKGIDITASQVKVDTNGCPDSLKLSARIGNAGNISLAPGIKITFSSNTTNGDTQQPGSASTTKTLSPGQYEDIILSLDSPDQGTKTIYVNADDNGSANGALLETNELNNTAVANLELCPYTSTTANSISGKVIDAATGLPLIDVIVSLNDSQNSTESIAVTNTDGHGYYFFEQLTSGFYTIVAEHTGFITDSKKIALADGKILAEQNIVLSPELQENEIRIVLTWDKEPADLESHLTLLKEGDCREHCYFWKKAISTAKLDLDDQNGYGPETITISQPLAGTFRYYVHDWTNRLNNSSYGLGVSGATVKVYTSNSFEPLVYSVPSKPGTVWHVFDYDGQNGKFTSVNKMSSQENPGEIDFPKILDDSLLHATAGIPYSYQINATDPDNDQLIYSLNKHPYGMTINEFTGQINWTPTKNQIKTGGHEVEVIVKDEHCGIDKKIFYIYVGTITLNASPSTIYEGNTSTLYWSADSAYSCSIDQGIGSVASIGSLQITPNAPTTYILTCVGPTETLVANASIEIVPPPPPPKPIVSFTGPAYCNGDNYPLNGTLNWATQFAETCAIEPAIGEVDLTGSISVPISINPVPYNLTASNASGTSTASVFVPGFIDNSITSFSTSQSYLLKGDSATLYWSTQCLDRCELYEGAETVFIEEVPCSGYKTVTPDQSTLYTLKGFYNGEFRTERQLYLSMEPRVWLSAVPSNYIPGQPVTLEWSSFNAETVFIEPEIGEVAPNGSITVYPTSDTLYTITAYGPEGIATDQASISYAKPSVSFSADQTIVKTDNTPVKLTWHTNYADTVQIMPEIGQVAAEGSVIVYPSTTTTYTLSASGPGGTSQRKKTVSFIKPAVTFYAEPSVILPRESTTLTWISSLADYCVISNGIGTVPATGSIQISPYSPTTYSIIAYGPGGKASASTSVSMLDVSLQAFPTNIAPGQNTTLSWSSKNANYCVIEPGVGEVPANGTVSVEPSETINYTIKAFGSGKEAVDEVTITVGELLDLPTKLVPDDLHQSSFFGTSVDIDGDYAIIGSYVDIQKGNAAGAAYIYKFNGNNWVQQAKIFASDAATGMRFGFNVVIDGNYAAVTNYKDRNSSTNGVVYIFKRDGETWTEQAKLTARDTEKRDIFGASIALDDDYLVVGAPGKLTYGGYQTGAAYVFKRDHDSWTQHAKLLPTNAQSYSDFGKSVTIDKEYIIVGAPGGNDTAAYVFKREGWRWTEQAALSFKKIHIGESVALDGEYAIIGADRSSYYSGVVYIYKREGEIWLLKTALNASDNTPGDYFGRSVSIQGKYAVVGAVGANLGDLYNAGAAYVFERVNENWIEKSKLVSINVNPYDNFGSYVAIDGSNIIVTHSGFNDIIKGENSGAAFIFSVPDVFAQINASPEITLNATTLSWQTSNANSVSIDPDIGQVPFNGSIEILPETTTTYTITATGPLGTTSDSVKVVIGDPPPEINLQSTNTNILFGDSTSLSWSVTSANSAYIDNGIGQVPLNSSIIIAPTETTMYTLTANGPGGPTSKHIVIFVYPPPSISISADPITVYKGSGTTISWEIANADISYLKYYDSRERNEKIAATGSKSLYLNETKEFTITATGLGGTVSKTVEVTAIDPPPTIWFWQTNTWSNIITISRGESVTLAWDVSYADSSVIKDSNSQVIHSFTEMDYDNNIFTVTPTTSTIYTLTATGQGGTSTQSITVNVVEPPTASLTADPEIIVAGESTTLSWETTNASFINIDNNIGTVAPTGTLVVTPEQTTTYLLTATGAGGSTNAAVTVKVLQADEIALVIDSPKNDDTVIIPSSSITGRVLNGTGKEFGVNVNGITAHVFGNEFVVNNVPLVEGTNTITAVATQPDGSTVTDSITVFRDTLLTTDWIELNVNPESGVAPFKATLNIDPHLSFSPPYTQGSYYISTQGPGAVTITENHAHEWQLEFADLGIYTFTYTIEDDQGNPYTSQPIAVVVLDRLTLDALLKAKWNGMKSALAASDVDLAVSYFSELQKETFREIYTLLQAQLPDIAANMQEIEMIDLTGKTAEYRIKRDMIVNGVEESVTFYLYFDKGVDGLWRIRDY